MTRRRPLVAAACLLLAGCAILPSFAPGALPPDKSTPSLPSQVLPTPFHPSLPTPPGPAPAAVPTGVDAWPPPYTFGSAPTPPVPVPEPAPLLEMPDGSLTVLLLGSDRRGGAGFRTDTIVVATIRPTDGLVVLLSIPRDLYVVLPGYGMSRINTAWGYGQTFEVPGGGPRLLLDTIRYNLGLEIDRYALVEMSGFRRIVDLLGGIEVRVACRYTDWKLRRPELPESLPSSWALFTVQPGVVRMNGDDALWYARARLRSTDFDRSRRQHEVLRAFYREGLRPSSLTRLPELYQAFLDSVTTDVTLKDVLTLAPFAAGLEPAHVRSRFIGRDQVTSFRVPVTGAAVLLPRQEAIRALLTDAYAPPGPESEAMRTIRVEVVTGGDSGTAVLAVERLTFGGIEAFPSPDGGLAAGDPSRLLVHQGAHPAAIEAVIGAIGLSPDRVSFGEVEPGAPWRLEIGADYQPCFDPTRDQ